MTSAPHLSFLLDSKLMNGLTLNSFYQVHEDETIVGPPKGSWILALILGCLVMALLLNCSSQQVAPADGADTEPIESSEFDELLRHRSLPGSEES